MDISILSNYMFGILVILLIIVIIVMYYLWNETKKNKNQISILESDVIALRERVENNSKKMDEIENFENNQSSSFKKSPSKMLSQQNILEQLMGNINIHDYMNNGDEEEEYDDDEEEEYEEEDENDDEEDEEEDENDDEEDDEDEEEEYEEEGEEEYEEEEEEEYEEEEGNEEANEIDEEEVKENILDIDQDNTNNVEEDNINNVEEDNTNNVEEYNTNNVEEYNTNNVEEYNIKNIVFEANNDIEMEVSGKKPIKSASNFEEGYIEKGLDKKMYVVALNKRGVKYWKVQK